LPFDLALLGRFNPLGTIRLHVSRFLHVTVALRYQSKRATDELPSAAYGDLAEIELPPQYDLNIQRRTRSGELHFFDHPAFGVLVLVQPAPEELEILEDELAPAA
ncbi:MAG TPA: CsiV family protein, partial [Gammaproteobacteria bacterium]|nr:CsiV family protein [Gammaproteobacteria bacterium]